MSVIDFYYLPGSPPCIFVELTGAALGIDHRFRYHSKDMRRNETLEEDFIKINPQHTAPVIIDEGFTLWESRAICKYLVAKYGKEEHKNLYPADIKTRAVIDQRLDFDLGTLYARFYEYYYWQIIDGSPLSENRFKMVQEALGFLNSFLEGNKFAVGSNMTLADLNLAVTIETMRITDNYVQQYPNIVRWFELVKRTAPKFDEILGKFGKDHSEAIEYYKEATFMERAEQARLEKS
ncbi:PREDICTED: glutathione S-transferase 1, isoform D-like isoform X2 [Papilio polytes]|uniref:glutathione S-transferase 1, isoform D-like isoform X2 n=1 Tax=Papilio polytes TaxID=76194 RepID=UPI0006763D7D|nr:PREDICTED: glutathione S-transferase 1, isoform D-like isoform X2 [Papilio polytes]